MMVTIFLLYGLIIFVEIILIHFELQMMTCCAKVSEILIKKPTDFQFLEQILCEKKPRSDLPLTRPILIFLLSIERVVWINYIDLLKIKFLLFTTFNLQHEQLYLQTNSSHQLCRNNGGVHFTLPSSSFCTLTVVISIIFCLLLSAFL
jgi:hypothetical protein